MFTWEGFADIAVQHDPEFTISYRTANFVFEEGLRSGRWLALSYNAAGYLMGANPLPKPCYMDTDTMPCPQSFEAVLDGQGLISHFVLENHEIKKEGSIVSARVTLKHTIRPVKVHVCTRLDGTPIMERHIEIENLKEGPAALSELAPLSGGVQVLQRVFGLNAYDKQCHESIYRLGYMEDSVWGTEGGFHWENLPNALFTIGGRYRRDRHRHPMFILNNTITGEYFIAQFAWSGGYAFSFDFQNEPERTPSLGMKISVEDPAPLCVIKPGETWVSPAVHIGAVFGGLDNAVNSMHRHVRKVIHPKKPGMRELIESAIGPEYVMSEENTLKTMEYAASFGAEVFFIDAGWYTEPGKEGTDWYVKVGDWRFDKERYPRGIGALRDRCHEMGMRFGVWMEPERVGEKSQIRREHPEWLQKTYAGAPNGPGLLDLGIPECAAWVERQITSLIGDNKLDFFRLDWNVDAFVTINARETEGWLECTRVRYLEAIYSIFARLRARFPEVIFENCAGGGGRTDLGMARYFTHTWVTDWQIHPNAFRVTNGMSIALPPEHIDRLIGGQQAFVTGDLQLHLRNLMFTHITIGGITPAHVAVNEKQLEIIKHHLALYKEFVRPFIADSNVYHHTPELPRKKPIGYGALELDAADGLKGILGVFQLDTPQNGEIRIKLRGIDASRSYRVTFDNTGAVCTVSGYELTQKGVCINLEGALSSELVLYEAV
ncbi:MAG: alpha-galactosidase [Treponema sp.]|jgi:alpha-galactosidase|nr:alpha-galactosidase [Treponema sp.]